jgi:hypothetical protein
MAEPLRHRQTKEADNRYVPPKATAPHLDSTDIVAKLFSRLSTRNFDSRMSQSAQFRIRDAGFSDSIIARWQRSKEFCNKIGPEPKSRHVRFYAAVGG